MALHGLTSESPFTDVDVDVGYADGNASGGDGVRSATTDSGNGGQTRGATSVNRGADEGADVGENVIGEGEAAGLRAGSQGAELADRPGLSADNVSSEDTDGQPLSNKSAQQHDEMCKASKASLSQSIPANEAPQPVPFNKEETEEQYDPPLNLDWRTTFAVRETIFDSRPVHKRSDWSQEEVAVLAAAWALEERRIAEVYNERHEGPVDTLYHNCFWGIGPWLEHAGSWRRYFEARMAYNEAARPETPA
jgi:hypothetical protein